MICLSVCYPAAAGARFDHEYYQKNHRALVVERLGNMVRMEMDRGLSGIEPGSAPAFAGFARLYFDSIEDLQQALSTHAPELMADIPKYTDIEPQFQISETS